MKLLTSAVLLACICGLYAGGTSAQVGVPCIPGVELPGCEPPASGPPDDGGNPQPPPQPPPPPSDACSVTASSGKGTFTGLVAEQIYGTNSNYRGCALSKAATVGVRIIRQPMRWAELERSPGVYDFSWWDPYMAALASHRIQLMPILFEPPTFRSGAPSSGAARGVYPPRRYADMGRFAAIVAKRYGPKGSFWKANPGLPKVPIRVWQIWNEPNLPFYWPPKPNAKAYVKLLAKVGKAIKRVHRGAEIVTAGFPQSKTKGSTPQLTYLRQLYKAGGKKHFDTLAIHSYTETHAALVAQLKGIRAVMRTTGDRAKLWITEIGWATGGPDKKFTPGPAGQAKRINQTFKFAKKNRRSLGIRGIVYYMWQDADPYPGFKDFWGLHTGLLDKGGAEKPGMATFRRHAQKLKNTR